MLLLIYHQICRTGFRLGILKGFSDDYLELFGEILSTDYPGSKREEKIECGRRIIEKIKAENLREARNTKEFLANQSTDVQLALTNILDRIQKEKIDIYTGDITVIQEIVEQEKEAFKKKRIQQFFETKGTDIPLEQRQGLEDRILQKLEAGIELDQIEEGFAENLNRINSERNKIEEFATKMLRVRSSVVYEITSRMKEYFINDLLKNSQDSDTPQFSNAGWNLFFKAKNLNYKEFVQYTNWDYQTTELPKTALNLVEQCAESLVKSGAIRNKFYEGTVQKFLSDEEAKKYMRTKYRPESEYESYRKEHGIGDLKNFTRPSRKFTAKKQYNLMKLYSDLYSYVQNEDEVFAMRYQDTFNAIPVRIRRKVDLALESKIEEPIDDEKDSENLQKTKKHFQKHLYHDELKGQIYRIREELSREYGTLDLTEDQISEYVKKQVENELKDMELAIARQLAKEYLAGMTDRSFIDIAIKTGYLSPDVITKAKRGEILSENVLNLSRAINKQQEQQGQEDEGR